MAKITNVAFITLPMKNWSESRLFLERFGIRVIGADYPVIRVGFALAHGSGVIARIREVRQVRCGRGSVITRWQLKVTNMTCDPATFQKYFYDYIDSITLNNK